MKFFKLILDFYINTSIHVAVAVFSLVQITKLQLNISSNASLEHFIFFGTILGYNFLKYFEVFWHRIFTLKKNFEIILISIIAFFGIVFYFLRLTTNIQLEFLKIGLFILIYPFIRKYGLFKMVYVSFCLTLITVYVIEINHNNVYLVQRFLIIFCLLIPLEISDLKLDSKTIKTLPNIIGIQNLKLLGYCLLILIVVLQFDIFLLIYTFLIAFCIFLSNENKSKYFASFWVESLPILWWINLCITKYLYCWRWYKLNNILS
jgi:hypothetical protein